MERRLAQWLAAPIAPLLGKIALERLGPDMERLKLLIPSEGFKPGDRLGNCVYGLLAVALSLGKTLNARP
jgi:hypothetical protein